MNIIVTGSAGFIGTNLVEDLKREHNVFRLDIEEKNPVFRCDLSDPENVVDYGERVLQVHQPQNRVKIDAVVHMAAIGSISRCQEHPDLAWEANILGFSSAIGLARLSGAKKFIYASSSAVYAGHRGKSLTHQLAPAPQTYYGATKAANEDMALAAQHGYGLRTHGLRFFNVVGPHQKLRGGYSALVPAAADACDRGNALPLYNMGENTRSFTPVSYVCDVVRWLLTSQAAPAILNVGSPYPMRVLDMVHRVFMLMEKPIAIRMEPKRAWEAVESKADMSFEYELPGFPNVSDRQLDSDLRKFLAVRKAGG